MPRRKMKLAAEPAPMPQALTQQEIANLHTQVRATLYSDGVRRDEAYQSALQLLRMDPTSKHTSEMLGRCLYILGIQMNDETTEKIKTLRMHTYPRSENEKMCNMVLDRIQSTSADAQAILALKAEQ